MGMGKRAESRRQKFRGATEALAGASLHVFQDGLNTPLAEVRFDHSVESICEAYYNSDGRPSIPLGTYSYRLLDGYFGDL